MEVNCGRLRALKQVNNKILTGFEELCIFAWGFVGQKADFRESAGSNQGGCNISLSSTLSSITR